MPKRNNFHFLDFSKIHFWDFSKFYLQFLALKNRPKRENNRKVEGHFVWTVTSPLMVLEYRSRCLKISTERALSIKFFFKKIWRADFEISAPTFRQFSSKIALYSDTPPGWVQTRFRGSDILSPPALTMVTLVWGAIWSHLAASRKKSTAGILI